MQGGRGVSAEERGKALPVGQGGGAGAVGELRGQEEGNRASAMGPPTAARVSPTLPALSEPLGLRPGHPWSEACTPSQSDASAFQWRRRVGLCQEAD